MGYLARNFLFYAVAFVVVIALAAVLPIWLWIILVVVASFAGIFYVLDKIDREVN